MHIGERCHDLHARMSNSLAIKEQYVAMFLLHSNEDDDKTNLQCLQKLEQDVTHGTKQEKFNICNLTTRGMSVANKARRNQRNAKHKHKNVYSEEPLLTLWGQFKRYRIEVFKACNGNKEKRKDHWKNQSFSIFLFSNFSPSDRSFGIIEKQYKTLKRDEGHIEKLLISYKKVASYTTLDAINRLDREIEIWIGSNVQKPKK